MMVANYWDVIVKDQYPSVLNALGPYINKYPKAPIVFTGHSLGAATMTLMLAYLHARDEIDLPLDRLFIYTYGQPRVGGDHFAGWYNQIFENQFRVVHYNDVVPHLPCCNQ